MMLNPPPAPEADGAMLNTRQAAERLGVTTHALEAWRLRGGGPPFAKLGSAVRYRVADLDGWVAAKIVSSTSELELR